MTPTRIHHINFVVHDLDAAILRYESELGFPCFERVKHGPRGSEVATASIGETTFVLVCPYDPQSVPGRYLTQHGEGFFLLSLGVDDFDAALETLPTAGAARAGIRDWTVSDLGSVFGAELQLTRGD